MIYAPTHLFAKNKHLVPGQHWPCTPTHYEFCTKKNVYSIYEQTIWGILRLTGLPRGIHSATEESVICSGASSS